MNEPPIFQFRARMDPGGAGTLADFHTRASSWSQATFNLSRRGGVSTITWACRENTQAITEHRGRLTMRRYGMSTIILIALLVLLLIWLL